MKIYEEGEIPTEIPTNNATKPGMSGLGGVNGEPGVYAGSKKFKVNNPNFVMAKMMKRKQVQIEEYITDTEILEYARQNRHSPIILENELTGAILYLSLIHI